MPVGFAIAVRIEPIRRVAVHVFPRARFGNGARQTQVMKQATSESRLLVLVLVERLFRGAQNGRKRPERHEWTATAAAPTSIQVTCINLLEGPLLRTCFFLVGYNGIGRVVTKHPPRGRSIGRERRDVG